MTTTLLAVDDSKTMRKVLEITFAVDGFRASIAASADEAFHKLQAERPQVVLVDAGLEGMNGYDLCQRIKSFAPNTPVVILSSKQQPYDRARGAAVGADDFADKPFDTQQLLDKVTLLARKAATAAAAPPPMPAAAPSPIAARPPVPVSASAQPERQRVQTLAYGSAPAPAVQSAAPAPRVAQPPASAPRPTFPEPASARPYVAPQAAAPVYAPPQPPAPAPAPAPPPYVAQAPIAAAVSGANGADFAQKLGGLGLTAAQIEGVLALSREVVEKVVWEVVPTLAEAIIKEEIQRLTAD